MNKKLLIIIGILVAILTAIVLFQVWGVKNNSDRDTTSTVQSEVSQEAPVDNSSVTTTPSGEIDELEAQIEALDNDLLSDEALSDEEVGL